MTVDIPPQQPDITARQRILDTAAGLLSERGYGETSLRILASEVGIKAASVYYHFDSKEALYVEVLQAGMDIMIDRFEEVAGTDGTSGRGRLQAHVSGHLDALHSNLQYTALHVSEFRTAPPSVRAALVPRRDEYESMWTDLLTDILPDISRSEISILRLSLFGAMNSSIDWFDAAKGGFGEFSDVITDAFWAGATTRKRRVAS